MQPEDNAMIDSIISDAEHHKGIIKNCQEINNRAKEAEMEMAKSIGAIESLAKVGMNTQKYLTKKYNIPDDEVWDYNPETKKLEFKMKIKK